MPDFLTELLKNPETWAWVATALLTLFGLWKRDKAKRLDEAILRWAPVAYQVVNEVARETETEIDDKLALFIKELDDLLRPDGLKVDEAKARALSKAFHAREKGAPAVNPPTAQP